MKIIFFAITAFLISGCSNSLSQNTYAPKDEIVAIHMSLEEGKLRFQEPTSGEISLLACAKYEESSNKWYCDSVIFNTLKSNEEVRTQTFNDFEVNVFYNKFTVVYSRFIGLRTIGKNTKIPLTVGYKFSFDLRYAKSDIFETDSSYFRYQVAD